MSHQAYQPAPHEPRMTSTRALKACTLAAGCGIGLAVGVSLVNRAREIRREQAAVDALQSIVRAQQAFRKRGGRGGYTTELRSLSTPCPGEAQPALDAVAEADGAPSVAGYRLVLRAKSGSRSGPVDCHGWPTAADYLASAGPNRPGIDGSRAFAVMASGRVYYFVDGVPPTETDMEPGGLAISVDAPLRIP